LDLENLDFFGLLQDSARRLEPGRIFGGSGLARSDRTLNLGRNAGGWTILATFRRWMLPEDLSGLEDGPRAGSAGVGNDHFGAADPGFPGTGSK
jgi:hypothetical protein